MWSTVVKIHTVKYTLWKTENAWLNDALPLGSTLGRKISPLMRETENVTSQNLINFEREILSIFI